MANWKGYRSYQFNGNGHKITIDCEGTNTAALFAEVSGTVKNLTVAGTVKGGAATGNAYVVGIAAKLVSSASMIGCTNEAKISVNIEEAAGSQYVGGLFACGAAGNIVEDNVNAGAIDVYVKSPENVNVVGGITGFAYSSLKNCRNTADIVYDDDISSGKAQYLGGIAGRLKRTESHVIDGCVNEGNLTFKTQQATNNYLGGIVADAEGEKQEKNRNKLVACINKGDVISDSPATTTANSGKVRMGGLCGSHVDLDSCTNEGLVKINQGATGRTEYAIGGFCGIVSTGSWKNCKQLGDVVNNLGKANVLAHTGGFAGWVLGNIVIEDCGFDGNLTSTILYNYDQDKDKGDDLTHKNSGSAGIICGRISSDNSVKASNTKVYGTITRTINLNEEIETTDFTKSVPADSYLCAALQSSTSIFEATGTTCARSK